MQDQQEKQISPRRHGDAEKSRKEKTIDHRGHEGTQRKSGDRVIARDPVIGKAKA
jgi:hypothetical protein